MANRLICLQAVTEPPNRGEDQGFLDRTSDRRAASQRGGKFRQRWPGHNRHSTLRSEPEQPSVIRQAPSKGSHESDASQQNPRGSPRTNQ